ncbi:hypothetical protein Tco_0466434 [Tanacetum coccineum]
MFHNLDQLRLQFERENLQEVNAKTCLGVLRTQFKEFFAFKGVNSLDYLNQLKQEDFKDYTGCKPETYRSNLLNYLDILEKFIDKRVLKYGELWMKESEMQMQEGKVDTIKLLDDSLFVMESSRTKSEKHDTSSRSRNDTYAEDADVRPKYDEEPLTEVQLTAKHNVLANEQQHTEQSKPIYDMYVLEMVDSNTTPDSTDMSNNG